MTVGSKNGNILSKKKMPISSISARTKKYVLRYIFIIYSNIHTYCVVNNGPQVSPFCKLCSILFCYSVNIQTVEPILYLSFKSFYFILRQKLSCFFLKNDFLLRIFIGLGNKFQKTLLSKNLPNFVYPK